MEKLRTAALYIRVSSHAQEELSPDAQKRLLLDFAKKNSLIVPKEFIFMEAVSGRDAKKRHEFQKMIALAKSAEHPIDAIIVWKYSRFARNQEESIVYKSMLKKDSVEVLSVSEPLIDGPFGTLIERIIEWMDEYYSIRLSGEVLRGMKEKALRKGYQTTPCLGYDAVGGGKPFVINEAEIQVVKYIMKMHDTGRDSTRIARLCNERGYRTKRGNVFERRNIEYILRNPFYAGIVEWDGITFEGEHESIITKEELTERIRLMDARRRPVKARNVSTCKHWLSGLLKCSICGATMSYGGSEKCRTFTCWKYAKGMHKESSSISVKKVEAAVFQYFDQILSGGDYTYVYKGSAADETNDEISILQKELDKISIKEKRIRDAYEDGIDTLAEYKENKERLRRQKEDIENEISVLRNRTQKTAAPSNEDVLREIRTVNDMLKNPDISIEEKGVLIRTVLDGIVFDKANKRLYFDIVIT